MRRRLCSIAVALTAVDTQELSFVALRRIDLRRPTWSFAAHLDSEHLDEHVKVPAEPVAGELMQGT